MHMPGRIGMQDCIDACDTCRQQCLSTIAYGLEQGGRHARAEHIRLLADCAEICQTSANFMSRASAHHAETCGLCAEICEACALSCEQLGEDAEMQRCAEACRACADSCREMASHASA